MRTKDDYYGRAILAAFLSTIVITLIYLVMDLGNTDPNLAASGTMPINMIQAMAAAFGMPGQPVLGWIMHFFFGSIIGGIVFCWLSPKLFGHIIVRGLVFGLLCWLVLMVVVMPAAGYGFFAQKLDMMQQIMLMTNKLVYGGILGWLYGRLIAELSKPVSERIGEKNEGRSDQV